MRGATKAAVLKGDPECLNLVTFSVYDTKPVHFLSMPCTNLKWREKERCVFDKGDCCNVIMKFLHTKVNDDYNNGMNNVDIADQQHGTYCFDCWMHKRKWWWAIWMWGIQLLLLNAYVLYKTAHLLIWKRQKKDNELV